MGEWKPIDSAPKAPLQGGFSSPRVLLWDGKQPRFGHWDSDLYAKRPRPYWRYTDAHFVSDSRGRQPTHWYEGLPAPPPETSA